MIKLYQKRHVLINILEEKASHFVVKGWIWHRPFSLYSLEYWSICTPWKFTFQHNFWSKFVVFWSIWGSIMIKLYQNFMFSSIFWLKTSNLDNEVKEWICQKTSFVLGGKVLSSIFRLNIDHTLPKLHVYIKFWWKTSHFDINMDSSNSEWKYGQNALAQVYLWLISF